MIYLMLPGGARINLHDPGHVSWVESTLYRSRTTRHNGRLDRDDLDDLDRDRSDVSDVWVVSSFSCNLTGWWW